MKTKRRVVQVLLVALISALLVLMWRPAKIQYYLYQFRSDVDSAELAREHACSLGASVREPLIDAIYAHASDPDIGAFRPAAFQALACLREAAVDESPAHFMPPDEEAIAAMCEVYTGEPSAEHRSQLNDAIVGLDEWSYLSLWERVEERDDRLPPFRYTPTTYEDKSPVFRGGWQPEDITLLFADEWCAHIGPILHRWLAEGDLGVSDLALIRRLSERDCIGDGSIVIDAIQERRGELSESALDEFLLSANANPHVQTEIFTQLTELSASCDWQRRLLRHNEMRRAHTDDTKDALRAWVASIEDSCLAEIYQNHYEPAANHRSNIVRSLGLASD